VPEEQEILPWTQRFLQDVFEMRQAQKDYYRGGRTDYKLRIAKAKETKVDEILKQAISKGFLKTKNDIPDQQNLF
jgi:DNA-binding Lrp family transcriptional regulator